MIISGKRQRFCCDSENYFWHGGLSEPYTVPEIGFFFIYEWKLKYQSLHLFAARIKIHIRIKVKIHGICG